MAERIVSRRRQEGEAPREESLRPLRLSEFVGQETTKKKLSICIAAARGRKEALEHILLSGPPGLGKTTLAGIVAREMEVSLRYTSGPVLERKGRRVKRALKAKMRQAEHEA